MDITTCHEAKEEAVWEKQQQERYLERDFNLTPEFSHASFTNSG